MYRSFTNESLERHDSSRLLLTNVCARLLPQRDNPILLIPCYVPGVCSGKANQKKNQAYRRFGVLQKWDQKEWCCDVKLRVHCDVPALRDALKAPRLIYRQLDIRAYTHDVEWFVVVLNVEKRVPPFGQTLLSQKFVEGDPIRSSA